MNDPFEIKENISQMSDEELVRVVTVDARQYQPEAIEIANAEIARRGLTINHLKCVKCAGAMEEGFIPDFGHYEYVRLLKWIAGKPEKSFWKGMKVDEDLGESISAYRCTECGYIEFYAN